MIDLKPCPFCGGEVKINRFSGCSYDGQTKTGAVFVVGCNNCHFDFKRFTVTVTIEKNGDLSVVSEKEEAIKAWNKRAEVKQD